jgi:hypothetical protein
MVGAGGQPCAIGPADFGPAVTNPPLTGQVAAVARRTLGSAAALNAANAAA